VDVCRYACNFYWDAKNVCRQVGKVYFDVGHVSMDVSKGYKDVEPVYPQARYFKTLFTEAG
jgi:hypothetical protein